MRLAARVATVLVVMGWTGWVWAGTVVVVGTAAQGGQAGHQQALEAALVQAVVQRAAASAGVEALASQLEEFTSRVLSKAKDFVKSYHLRASASSGDMSVVVVEVELDEAAIDQVLAETGVKLDVARLGKVAILVSEEVAPGRPPVFWWAAAPAPVGLPAPVKAVVKTLGVNVISPQKAAGLIPEELRTPILSEAQGRQVGEVLGADVVVLGSVRCYPLVGEHPEAPPVVQLVAIETATGRTLGIEELTGGVYPAGAPPQAAQELTLQVQKAFRQLLAKACAARPPVRKPKSLRLVVQGVTSLEQLVRLEQVLGGLKECVEELRRCSVGGGEASYDLRLSCSPSRLADTLLVQDYGGFMVNVTEVGGERMRIRLVPRP